jgi:hypothetical protein
LSRLKKLLKKLYADPIPKDMTLEEIRYLAQHFGGIMKTGGEHPFKLIFPQIRESLSIPYHGKHVHPRYTGLFRDMVAKVRGRGDSK